MTKECPSCGNVVEAGQLYCPVCGTKINNVDQLKKSINSALENDLARAEVYASAVLYEKSTKEVIVVEKNSEILNQINGEFRPFTMEMPFGEIENRETN